MERKEYNYICARSQFLHVSMMTILHVLVMTKTMSVTIDLQVVIWLVSVSLASSDILKAHGVRGIPGLVRLMPQKGR